MNAYFVSAPTPTVRRDLKTLSHVARSFLKRGSSLDLGELSKGSKPEKMLSSVLKGYGCLSAPLASETASCSLPWVSVCWGVERPHELGVCESQDNGKKLAHVA